MVCTLAAQKSEKKQRGVKADLRHRARTRDGSADVDLAPCFRQIEASLASLNNEPLSFRQRFY